MFTPRGKVTYLLTPPLLTFVFKVFIQSPTACCSWYWKMKAQVTASWLASQRRRVAYYMEGNVQSRAVPGCIPFSFIESYFLQGLLW